MSRKPSRKDRLAVDQLAMIRFLDHSEGEEEIDFTVYGRVVSKTQRAYTLACWHYTAHPAPDSNETRYTILKSTILEAVRLTPAIASRRYNRKK